jgi:hypothetical protein
VFTTSCLPLEILFLRELEFDENKKYLSLK